MTTNEQHQTTIDTTQPDATAAGVGAVRYLYSSGFYYLIQQLDHAEKATHAFFAWILATAHNTTQNEAIRLWCEHTGLSGETLHAALHAAGALFFADTGEPLDESEAWANVITAAQPAAGVVAFAERNRFSMGNTDLSIQSWRGRDHYRLHPYFVSAARRDRAAGDTTQPDDTARIDAGIVPLVLRSRTAAGYQVYSVLRAADDDGRGYVSFSSAVQLLRAAGVAGADKTLRRRVGRAIDAGYLWREGDEGERLHYLSDVRLFEHLARRVIDDGHEETALNTQPAKARVYIDAAGNAADFAARIYAAWIGASKDNRRTHTRAFASSMTGLSIPTMLDYETRAGVDVRTNYRQTADDKLGGRWGAAADTGEGRPTWLRIDKHNTRIYVQQTANTYAHTNREHDARGRQRKLRAKYRAFLERTLAVSLRADGQKNRVFYESDDTAKAFTAADKHARKAIHGGPDMRMVFVGNRRTRRRMVGVFEVFDNDTGTQRTSHAVRSLPAAQYAHAAADFVAGNGGVVGTKTLCIDVQNVHAGDTGIRPPTLLHAHSRTNHTSQARTPTPPDAAPQTGTPHARAWFTLRNVQRTAQPVNVAAWWAWIGDDDNRARFVAANAYRLTVHPDDTAHRFAPVNAAAYRAARRDDAMRDYADTLHAAGYVRRDHWRTAHARSTGDTLHRVQPSLFDDDTGTQPDADNQGDIR